MSNPSGPEQPKSPLKEITQPFVDLVRAPRALWGINLSYLIEGMVYFGILGYLAMYFNDYIGLNDVTAGRMVGVLTAGITIAMFFLGTVADKKGVRFALLAAFVLLLAGRAIISVAPIIDSKFVDVAEADAGRNDPVFIFTDAEPVPTSEAATTDPAADQQAETGIAGDQSGTDAPEASVEDSAGTMQSGQQADGDADQEAEAEASPGLWSAGYWLAMAGILLVVAGYGMYQPGAYAAVRQFTSKKNSAMAYAMLYALMNLGGWIPTYAFILRNNRCDIGGKTITGAGLGILGVTWVYAAFTGVALLATWFILSRRTVDDAIAAAKAEREKEASLERGESAEAMPAARAAEKKSGGFFYAIWDYFANHPFTDPKFSFFIFCLIPVQTLFAHNWLTLPMYVERAYRDSWPWISKNFEPAVNFNPLLIFIFVPIVTALTQRAKVYNMMIIGTLVMAAPTFLLAIGPYWWTLLAYLVIMTIGEAMWQPRFLQYAAEIAPEGRTGLYMGVAQFPWFLTKMIVPLYSGWFLQRYCPEDGVVDSEMMWLVYACIAMCSTFMLILAKGWLGKDFKTKAE